MDNFYNNIDDERAAASMWIATHSPVRRSINNIPLNNFLVKDFERTCGPNRKSVLYPSWKQHRKHCKINKILPAKKPTPGIPEDIYPDLDDHNPTKSIRRIYKELYTHSFYSKPMKKRICEMSYGWMKKITGYHFDTIRVALSFLRKYRYLNQIWRGRPDPEDPRYLHSCYEMPKNIRHVIYWRIHLKKQSK
jgi:hypothetical protein